MLICILLMAANQSTDCDSMVALYVGHPLQTVLGIHECTFPLEKGTSLA